MEAEKIAEGLSERYRRALVTLDSDAGWQRPRRGEQGSEHALWNRGLLELEHRGVVRSVRHPYYRLSPLGLAVRDILRGK